ncbi:unnamed protein product [Symbiodinium sp. CCMP2456]|nr:unnamed protein product [Symbiodinium sp. CCMP2456]
MALAGARVSLCSPSQILISCLQRGEVEAISKHFPAWGLSMRGCHCSAGAQGERSADQRPSYGGPNIFDAPLVAACFRRLPALATVHSRAQMLLGDTFVAQGGAPKSRNVSVLEELEHEGKDGRLDVEDCGGVALLSRADGRVESRFSLNVCARSRCETFPSNSAFRTRP